MLCTNYAVNACGDKDMNTRFLLTLALVTLVVTPLRGQRTRVNLSGGEVAASRPNRGDAARLAPRIPGIGPDVKARIRVSGDSAQRIAMNDFEWRGRVSSVEIDEEDARLFWDVKIVPDSTRETIVRYRVNATSGGILDIKEFRGIRGLPRRP